MGDHFVFLVDHLLTESTLEAAIQSQNSQKQLKTCENDAKAVDFSCYMDSDSVLSPRKLVECRICQDEDLNSNMETPCSCRGSLKYAHRRCVQRWCNEKGDTACEICHQHFKPGYTAPPPVFQIGAIPMNFRGHWQIARRELNNPRVVAMLSTDRNFINTYESAYSTPRSWLCCCAIALIFMFLLVLRHTQPIFARRSEHYSFPLLMLILLRILGAVLPIYFVLRAVTALIRRRHQQAYDGSLSSSDEEAGPATSHDEGLSSSDEEDNHPDFAASGIRSSH